MYTLCSINLNKCGYTYFMKKIILSHLHNFGKNFILCGVAGCFLEILFTAFDAFRHRDLRLRGATSLWMFPIYGSAAFIKPLSHFLRKEPVMKRGIIYMSFIYLIEFLTGNFLKKRNLCPWNYHRSSWQIKDIIRLDYAPLWFFMGLFFEAILKSTSTSHSHSSTRKQG